MTAPDTELPVIEFVSAMPGFPGYLRFALVQLDDTAVLYALTSLDDPELRFLVVAPAPFFPGYAPEVDDETLHLLGVRDAERLLVLLVVTMGGAATEATANLLAPIIVDKATRRAAQVVLSGSGLPIRAKLAA